VSQELRKAADISAVSDLTVVDVNVSREDLADLVHERRDPAAILDGLVRSVAGIVGCALASADGRSIAHSAALHDDPARSAMIAATMGLAGQLIGVAGGRDLHEVAVRSDAGYVIVYAAGAEGVLTVLARPSTNLHHVHSEVSARLTTLRTAVRERAR
jgi:predicted regulator of Ras-like GTPase activity (Roadblock/LC7/MglB family)